MRAHRNVSYFFVGSRRRVLLDMFNEQKRPFYKSAINYALGPLPKKEAIAFIADRFSAAHKTCSPDIASRVYEKAQGYPFYLQRIPHLIYEVSGKILKDKDYRRALQVVLQEEKPLFEAKLESLYPVWKQLLYALAGDPVTSPLSTAYLKRHNLSSPGSVQPALKNLIALDYVEKRAEDSCYHVVDLIFDLYLRQALAAKE